MIGSRLTTQIQMAALALVAVAGLALVYLLDRHQRDTVLTRLDAELENSVRLNGARFVQTVEVLRQDALFLSRTPPISGIVRAAQHGGIDPRDGNRRATWTQRLHEIFSAFAEAHPQYYLIRYIGVADGGREIVRIERRAGASTITPAAQLQRHADREYFRSTIALSSGEVYLSELGLDRVPPSAASPQRRTLRAATPVYDAAGRIFGMVMVDFDAGPILDTVSTGLPAGVRTYLADTGGNYLVHPDAARAFRFDGVNRLAQDFPELAAQLSGNRLALRAMTTADGVQHVAARRIHFDSRQPMQHVNLAYAVPDADVVAEVGRLRLRASLGGVMATALVAAGLLLLVSRLLAPLQRLTTAAEAIAVGSRDVVLPAPGRGGVGALVGAFRHMLTNIAAREQDYQLLNSELEDRVRVRTADLRRAAAVLKNTSEGVVVTDEDARIVFVNGAFTEITGYTPEEAIGQKPSLLRSDHHDADFYRAMWTSLVGEGRWQGEIWNRRKGGEVYLEWLTINRIPPADGLSGSYVAVFNDITEQRRKDEHIRHLAFHDALTGLPNRALLQDRLQHAIARALRENTRLAVIFTDLDRFKSINDSLGHDVGDMLLKEMAIRIKSHLRAMDTVARMGGDEFVVLLEDINEPEHCAAIAAGIIADVAQPLAIQDHDIHIGASLGIACYPEDGADAVTLMKHADTAMYAAKAGGRNTFRFFRGEMTAAATLRLQLENELRHAIANGELELHYQPKVSLVSGATCGVEALVRWRHPVRGLVSPADFIPVAEESDLIVNIGNWVIGEACRQSAAWQKLGLTPTIAVNVSARQLQQESLVEVIESMAAQHGIAPSRLQVEVTESLVMADAEQASTLLGQLRQIGVTVAIDDFGTGYSSLSYLRRLPIDVIKIDRSFVMNADRDEEDAQIVRTIVALAQSLRMDIVAEGVETAAQAELLRAVGCTTAQGFHYARPGPADEITERLRR